MLLTSTRKLTPVTLIQFIICPKAITLFTSRHEYSEGNWQVSGPYNDFIYHGTVPAADTDYGEAHLFYAAAQLPTSLSEGEACDFKNPSEDVFQFMMGVELVTPGKNLGEYDYYPVHEYASPNDIFSCMVL